MLLRVGYNIVLHSDDMKQVLNQNGNLRHLSYIFYLAGPIELLLQLWEKHHTQPISAHTRKRTNVPHFVNEYKQGDTHVNEQMYLTL